MESTQSRNNIDLNPELQIIILGSEKVEALFEVFKRNLCERWSIRYEKMSVSNVNYYDEGALGDSFIISILKKETAKQYRIMVSMLAVGERDSEGFNRFKLSALMTNARKIVFVWTVPESWFFEADMTSLVESEFIKQLVSFGQLLEPIRNTGLKYEFGVYIFQIMERTLKSGAKPWLAFNSKLDEMTLNAIKRKAPKMYRRLKDTIEEARFQPLPWSKNGSHLDYAPIWVDHFIFDELGLASDHFET